jgi:hypothetical protein
MERKELINRLITNEHSAFSDTDIEILEGMPDDMLKRIFLSTSAAGNSFAPKRADVAVNNHEADEQVQKAVANCMQSLKKVQKQIFELRASESKILDDLNKLGSNEKSIFNVDYQAISEADINLFVQNSQSDVAQVLREALEIRNRGRVDLIAQVISNSNGLFSEEDLHYKTLDELQKLATLAGGNSHSGGGNAQRLGALPAPLLVGSTVQNWRGAGMGNIPIANEATGGEPLGLLSTFDMPE